ncbi:hypothetical protein DSL72_007367 [Monilinia vaccinii-corymbosi]|uniref:Uncharacterized protein n=1 Tax=Monilinia vaccinii-corymbosi TaxID=61207 RepID=A0A8A3PMX5_9HELO|nr:hypothetical protein DSL72_007367 [Monilinia vaccinii-corymbosi]
MVNYLHAISFTWNSEVSKHAYLKALRCPKSFRKFWSERKKWQSNIGDAISTCLDALEETGIDSDGEYDESIGKPESSKGDDSDDGNTSTIQTATAAPLPNSLISVNSDTCRFFEEWVVTLFRSEHTWTGFLEDFEDSLTMAVVGMNCLDFHDQNGSGRRCSLSSQSKGYPVLQTSLQINESLLSGSSTRPKKEKVDSDGKTIWNARELKRGTMFRLGNHGALEVVSGSSELCPVVLEWKGLRGGKSVGGILKEMKNVGINKSLLGRGVELHHKEFIRGFWEIKPLPVLVLSKSAKVRLGRD